MKLLLFKTNSKLLPLILERLVCLPHLWFSTDSCSDSSLKPSFIEDLISQEDQESGMNGVLKTILLEDSMLNNQMRYKMALLIILNTLPIKGLPSEHVEVIQMQKLQYCPMLIKKPKNKNCGTKMHSILR